MRPQDAVPVVANKDSSHARCQVVSVHVPGDLEEVIFGMGMRVNKTGHNRQSRRVYSEGGFGIGRGIHGDNAVSADSDIACPRWVDRSIIDSAVNNKHIELVMSRNIRWGTGCEGK